MSVVFMVTPIEPSFSEQGGDVDSNWCGMDVGPRVFGRVEGSNGDGDDRGFVRWILGFSVGVT